MLKRILSLILCFSVLFCSLSLYMYTPVHASALDFSIYDQYKTIYDGYDFSSVISEHKSFNFTDKSGKKHAVKYGVNGWMYTFGRGGFINDDSTLNYFLSWYAYRGYNSDQGKIGIGIVSLLNSKLGVAASAASDIFDSVMVGTTDIDFEYDDTNGLSISSDSVDKLREEIKKQYCDSIGLNLSFPKNTPQFLIGKLSSSYEHEEDYISDYNNVKDKKYVFGYYTDDDKFCLSFNFPSEPSYFYYDSSGKLVALNNSYEIIDPFSITVYAYSIYRGAWGDMDFCGGDVNYVHYETSYNYTSGGLATYYKYETSGLGMKFASPLYYYSDTDKPLWFFRSYEALYNYLHGSQNAYLSSKIEQTGEDIKISIDDMNTNISEKMDSLIDSINNKKDGMTADELQNAIDKGLENISGKMDDIKNNTEETNNKLDSLLTVMQSQNEILMNILGVTTDIYNVVSSKNKEDGTSYTVADLQPHFNKCFVAVKNMVLYGVSSFDDVDMQAVDYDVGISVVSADSSYIMSDTGLIDSIGGRDFYKTNSGAAYVCTFKHGKYYGPLLVSDVAENVSYTTCNKTFKVSYTVEYASKTWYVSSDEYSMPDKPSQKGFARLLSSESMSSSDAALLLLKTAGVTDAPVVSPDYPEDVVKDYHNGLLGKFPFSVPYQLYEWLQVLQAEPKTPEFKYDYGFMLKYFGVSDIDTTIKFDLSQYDDWAQTARSFLKLSFTLAVAVGTYRKFKGVL